MPRKSIRWTVPVILALAAAGTPAVLASTGGQHASVALSGRVTAAGADLTDPHEKDIAMQVVSSAENSSLDWQTQYKYIEDIGDGRGGAAGGGGGGAGAGGGRE